MLVIAAEEETAVVGQHVGGVMATANTQEKGLMTTECIKIPASHWGWQKAKQNQKHKTKNTKPKRSKVTLNTDVALHGRIPTGFDRASTMLLARLGSAGVVPVATLPLPKWSGRSRRRTGIGPAARTGGVACMHTFGVRGAWCVVAW